MSSAGAAPRAAVPISNARAEASRRNGAKSRGPRTPEGKARSAGNALKHGMRAQKYVVLPEEDADEFEALQAALADELKPTGVLQGILVGRIARAAWRLERAERLEVEVFEERGWGANANPGVALIRDGNGTRSFETLLRYRGAAMAESMRSLRTLKALQAEQAAATGPALEAHPQRSAGRPPLAHRPQPNQPERATEPRLEYALPEPPTPGFILHEPAATWTPPRPDAQPAPTNPSPDHATTAPGQPNLAQRTRTSPRPKVRPSANRPAARPGPRGNARHGFPRSHGPTEQMPSLWLRLR